MPLLSPADQDKLRAAFDEMTSPVRVLFFTQAIYGVLNAVTRSTSFSWLSFFGNLSQMGSVVFRQPLKYDTPWPVSLMIILGLIVVSGVILERRVRGIEVVA